MVFKFEPMDEPAARQVLHWRYEPPYHVYNTALHNLESDLQLLLDPQNAYHYLTDEDGGLVAYCCFGPDGQVPGGDYGLEALDVGLGVRPDLTGKGLGSIFVAAVLDFARDAFSPRTFRVTIAEFNKRAMKVWKKRGFRQTHAFLRQGDSMPFVVMICEE